MKKIVLSLYILFLLFVTFFSYLFIDPNLIFMKSLYSGFFIKERLIVTIIYSSIILTFFAFYAYFLNSFRRKTFNFFDFKFIIVLTLLFLFLSYPAMVSFDIFNYIATAKVLFFYNENPYIIMPIQFSGDPLLLFMHAANKTALYGPVWILITAIPYYLGFGNFILTLFSFKLFAAFFYLASVWILHRMTKNVFYTSFFALNPLVVLETLVSGHNDIVMMFFALLSMLFLKDKKIVWAIIFIFLSIFIKFSTIFLLPMGIYVLFQYAVNKSVNWKKILYLSSFFMFFIFLLSPIREEMYPWYAIWFLTFLPFMQNRLIRYVYLAFSFGLLFRDIPFMLLGTYSQPTPIIRTAFTAAPIAAVFLYLFLKKITLQYFPKT